MRLSRLNLLLVMLVGLLSTGCDVPTEGEISGSVTVNGKVPADGSSITFIPMDGKSSTAGALLKEGRYTVRAPLGVCKVDIRVPRPIVKKGRPTGGPGAEGGGWIEESLPAKYNDQTELTFEVKPGKNLKDWDITP